jgi:hypothetical protein
VQPLTATKRTRSALLGWCLAVPGQASQIRAFGVLADPLAGLLPHRCCGPEQSQPRQGTFDPVYD